MKKSLRLNSLLLLFAAVLASPSHSLGFSNKVLDEWEQYRSKKNHGWYTIDHTNKRYLHDCGFTYCVSVDFYIGQLNVVATSAQKKKAISFARQNAYDMLLSLGEWKHSQLKGSPFNSQSDFRAAMSKLSPKTIKLQSGFASIITVSFSDYHYDRRRSNAEKIVTHYSPHFDLDARYVMRLIQSLSDFNYFSKARSSDHHGLLGVQPKTFGSESNEALTGVYRVPTKLELSMPATNVRLGMHHLSKIYNNYSFVEDDKARWTLTIIAYIWNEHDTTMTFNPTNETSKKDLVYSLPLVPFTIREMVRDAVKNVVPNR